MDDRVDASNDALAAALTEFAAQHYTEAERLCREVLRSQPDHAAALHLVGRISRRLGRHTLALAFFGKAVNAAPQNAVYRVRLGDTLAWLNRTDAARASFEQALTVDPAAAEAHIGLGMLCDREERYTEALAHYADAKRAAPTEAKLEFWRANALLATGRIEQARACYDRAIVLNPGYRRAHWTFGSYLQRVGAREAGLRLWQRGLQLNPADPTLTYYLATEQGGTDVPRMPNDVVVELFDDFASSFDERLSQLQYSTPQHMRNAVGAALGEPNGSLTVLDVGCGTGLCGPLFRPLARRLVGVDLSPGMLEKARERNVYDDLRTAELTDALRHEHDVYDLIVSSDVFVYLGDLAPVFAAARAALRTGGLLAYSVERHDQDDTFILQKNARYAHSAGYLRQASTAAGFGEVSMTAVTLRLERGEPVPGYVSVLRRLNDDERTPLAPRVPPDTEGARSNPQTVS